MKKLLISLIGLFSTFSLISPSEAQCRYGWEPVGNGINYGLSDPAIVYATAVDHNGSLIAGGVFATPGQHVAKWNGQTWDPLGAGLGMGGCNLNANCQDQDTIYTISVLPDNRIFAGGYFSTSWPIGGYNSVAIWDGTFWLPMSGGVTSGDEDGSVAASVIDSDGNLVIGGVFDHAGALPVNNVVKWNGTQWVAMGNGIPFAVRAMIRTHDGDIIAGAVGLQRWHNGVWTDMGLDLNGNVQAIAEMPNGDLMVGGVFWACTDLSGNTVITNGIARWDGTHWHNLGVGAAGSVYGWAYSILPQPNNKVLVGGHFDRMGGVVNKFIAEYDFNEEQWKPVPGLNFYVYTMSQMPDGKVAVGGNFWIPSNHQKFDLAFLHTPVCPADFNCDGHVDVQDIFDYLTFWFANENAQVNSSAADFNGDAWVDVNDVFDFLQAWFRGCN